MNTQQEYQLQASRISCRRKSSSLYQLGVSGAIGNDKENGYVDGFNAKVDKSFLYLMLCTLVPYYSIFPC